MIRSFLAPLAVLVLLGSALACHRLSDQSAERVVRAYNEKLMEAYRTGDAQIMESLVGDDEGRKLLALIGVKADMGITLDATLTDFKRIRVERPAKDLVDVVTEEQWSYRDRRIGTGQVVGEPSRDHYVMRYTLQAQGKTWIVQKVAFDQPPVVGRTSAPDSADAKVFHGMIGPAKPPAAPPNARRNP